MLRHKLAVGVFWLVMLVAGVAASAKLSSRLSGQFAIPGAASYQANVHIQDVYGNGGAGYPEVVLVRLPPGASPGGAAPAAARPDPHPPAPTAPALALALNNPQQTSNATNREVSR